MPDQVPPLPPAGGAPVARHLDSWGEIAAHLHRSISTVQRWEKQEGLPVHRIAHSKLGSIYAISSELDAWYEARSDAVPGPVHAAADGRITLAVLPFQNLSGSPEQDYFRDGLTEELITHLARLRPDRLAVIARTSAMQYRNTGKDVRAIGAELGVAYVLEGSIRRSGDRVRATAQLVATSDGIHLWAETYEQPLTDVIEIQMAIAERVGDSLSIQLLPDQHAAHAAARQTSPEARDEYLKGRFLWNQRTPDAFRHARGHFERAIQLDPNFAPAHAGLADTYVLLGFWAYGVLAPREAFPLARRAAEQALRLDPGLAEAYATLGFVHYAFDWDWGAADRSFRRALELNPSYATGHQWYSLCLALQRRSSESLAQIARARELNVLSYVVDYSVAWMHYLGRDYEEARQQCARALERNPKFTVTHLLLAGVHCYMGHREETFRAHDAYDRLHGITAIGTLFRACHQAHFGERQRARSALHKLEKASPVSWHLAVLHASLGDADAAFAALDRAFEERSDMLAYLKVEPHWDPLRSDPRFADMLHRVGLA